MSKELIEELRLAGYAKHADRIEELEREVERLNRIKSRTKQVNLVQERDALQADNARLREALERIGKYPRVSGDELGYEGCRIVAREALAATPDQSLARIRNQVREECAALCEDAEPVFDGYGHQCAKDIRAMKESE